MKHKQHWIDGLAQCFLTRLRRFRRRLIHEALEYAPAGWDTPLPPGEKGWLADSVLAEERRKWDQFAALVAGTGPLGFSHEAPDLAETDSLLIHNLHLTFGYVLLRAALGCERISVLDWGGGLGYYSKLAQAFLPVEIKLDYHCRDVPPLVAVGRKLAPQIAWHDDDTCLERVYDLVMVSASLQYCRAWKELLGRLRRSTGRYFFLTRIPVVARSPSFVAVQHAYGTQMLHQQFNEMELLGELESLGFRLVREVVTGDVIYIRNAPEDALMKGWLFTVPAN